jgi:hypothetical protein
MSQVYWLDATTHRWQCAQMIRRAYLANLTPADWAAHHRELNLLRSHLFRDRTPQSLHVIGEPKPIPPSVTVCWYPEPPVRTFLKGGLEFQIDLPGAHGPVAICVQHWVEDRYFLHASYFAENGAAYTRFSLTRPFESLPGCFVECIETMKCEFTTHPPLRREPC